MYLSVPGSVHGSATPYITSVKTEIIDIMADRASSRPRAQVRSPRTAVGYSTDIPSLKQPDSETKSECKPALHQHAASGVVDDHLDWQQKARACVTVTQDSLDEAAQIVYPACHHERRSPTAQEATSLLPGQRRRLSSERHMSPLCTPDIPISIQNMSSHRTRSLYGVWRSLCLAL